MTIAELLLADFDAEAISTKRVLERVPEDKADWKPHEKSMTVIGLARHVASLPRFGNAILTTPSMDLATAAFPKYEQKTVAELLELAAGEAAVIRTSLAAMSDEELQAEWALTYGEHKIANGPKYVLYRTMFFNHLIHHRGSLTVYLRLLDVKVPGIYGPSADEPFGS